MTKVRNSRKNTTLPAFLSRFSQKIAFYNLLDFTYQKFGTCYRFKRLPKSKKEGIS